MNRFRYVADPVPLRTIVDPETGLDVEFRSPDPNRQFIAYDRMNLPHMGATAEAAIADAKRDDAKRRQSWRQMTP